MKSKLNMNDPRTFMINEGAENVLGEYERVSDLAWSHPIRFVANAPLMIVGLMIFLDMISWGIFCNEDMFPSWIFSFVTSLFGYTVFLWICRIFYVIGLITFYHAIFIIILIPICKIFGVGKIRYVPMPQLDETYSPESKARQPESEAQATVQQESLEHNEGNQARFCRYCGSSVSPDMKFCGKCGKQL